jgi:hypothetical protein
MHPDFSGKAFSVEEYHMNCSRIFPGPKTGLKVSDVVGAVLLALNFSGCPMHNDLPDSPQASLKVTSVSVAPKTVDMWKGRTQEFTALVEGKDNPDQRVIWSVSGNSSANTKFKDNILHVAADEAEEHFTITATSKYDSTKSGSSAINLVRPIVTGVTIVQEDAAIHKGGSMAFNAVVEGLRGPDQDVVWSVEGNSSPDTEFQDNRLTIGTNESNTSWTVKATSHYNGEHSGSVTVKLAYKIDNRANTYGKIVATFQGLPCKFAPAGREISLAIESAPRFKLTRLNYEYGSKSTAIDIDSKTFTMPAADVTVSAVFGDFVVGDRGPGGGWIFYVERNTSRITRQGWKYLECAPVDVAGKGAIWGPPTEVDVSNPNEYGQGKSNTAKIISKPGRYPAAASTVAYMANGLKDWYLPGKRELEELKRALRADEFKNSLQDQYYWTSLEENTSNAATKGQRAWAVQLKSGRGAVLMNKDTVLSIRPMRQF